MKKTENTKTTVATETKATTNEFLTVSNVFNALTVNADKFEIIQKYDKDEFNVNEKDKASYANIRETDTKRSVIKLWGHKTYVTVECSKMLRKKELINVDKKLYTDKKQDKNSNYICDSIKDAIALSKDFLAQVEKMNVTVATEKTNDKAKTA